MLAKHVRPGSHVAARVKEWSVPVIGEVIEVDDDGVLLTARSGGTTYVSWTIVESLNLDVDPRINEYGVLDEQ